MTGVDFALANLLFFGLGLHGAAATGAAAVGGGVVSFLLSRIWAFRATSGSFSIQLDRYVFASAATAALNAGGVALLLLLNAPFPVSWLLTRALVFVCWSYPVQRDFVFTPDSPSSRPERAGSRPSFSAARTPRAPAGAPR